MPFSEHQHHHSDLSLFIQRPAFDDIQQSGPKALNHSVLDQICVLHQPFPTEMLVISIGCSKAYSVFFGQPALQESLGVPAGDESVVN